MPNCVVKGCKNQSSKHKKEDGITFHTFPNRDLNVRDKWIAVIRDSRNEPMWEPTSCSVVCSAHFLSDDLYNTKKGLRRVIAGGYPKIVPVKSKNDPAAGTKYLVYLSQPPNVQSFAGLEQLSANEIVPTDLLHLSINKPAQNPSNITSKKQKLRKRFLLFKLKLIENERKIKMFNQKVRHLQMANNSIRKLLRNLKKRLSA